MLQKKYPSKIVSINNPFQGIFTLEFKTSVGRYKYLPGQFLHLAVDEDYDGFGQWPDSRCFSMQSNPNEETIKITYAVKGLFTRQMEPHNKLNTVFIAGGTGITAFLSLFSHESFNQYINPRIYLGFRSKEYNIYTEELERLSNSSKLVKSFYENINGLLNI
ncbi:MAG: hypothetical protein NTY07_12500 [Bacteroidia bacterium]|nr:hypothetical protein [Bacteroidia bacterium]